MPTIDTLCWVLWFTVTLAPGQIGHFPVTGTFGSAAQCAAEGQRVWVPLLTSQWPTDPHRTVYCQPCATQQGA